jgi:hypothetical protein
MLLDGTASDTAATSLQRGDVTATLPAAIADPEVSAQLRCLRFDPRAGRVKGRGITRGAVPKAALPGVSLKTARPRRFLDVDDVDKEFTDESQENRSDGRDCRRPGWHRRGSRCSLGAGRPNHVDNDTLCNHNYLINEFRTPVVAELHQHDFDRGHLDSSATGCAPSTSATFVGGKCPRGVEPVHPVLGHRPRGVEPERSSVGSLVERNIHSHLTPI